MEPCRTNRIARSFKLSFIIDGTPEKVYSSFNNIKGDNLLNIDIFYINLIILKFYIHKSLTPSFSPQNLYLFAFSEVPSTRFYNN